MTVSDETPTGGDATPDASSAAEGEGKATKKKAAKKKATKKKKATRKKARRKKRK